MGVGEPSWTYFNVSTNCNYVSGELPPDTQHFILAFAKTVLRSSVHEGWKAKETFKIHK